MSKRKDHKGRMLQSGEYQRKNGTYEYRWTDASGDRRSVYAKSLTELRELEDQIVQESQKYQCHSRMTFGDLLAEWKKNKRGIKPETLTFYLGMYDRYVLKDHSKFDSMRLADIRKSTVKNLYTSIMESRGLKINSLLCINALLQQVFEMAVDDDLIPKNPATGAVKELRVDARIKQSMEKPERERAMTREEQDLFFDYLQTSRYRDYALIFKFMLLTGMRVGEVLALQWTDVDFEQCRINLRYNLTYTKLPGDTKICIHITSPKNKKWRVVPLCDEAVELLRTRFKQDAKLGRHCRVAYDGLINFVFVSNQNKPLIPHELTRVLLEVRKMYDNSHKDKMPPISCHWFRHTFATRMFEAGVQPKTVQEILGHSNCNLTLNIYTTVTEDLKLNGVRKMAEYMAE